MVRPDLNRARHVFSYGARYQINEVLQQACQDRYKELKQTENAQQRLEVFVEQFGTLPRAALDVISREGILLESQLPKPDNYCKNVESDLQLAISTIADQREQLNQLKLQFENIQSSRSWRLTAPLRSIVSGLRSVGR